MHYCYIPRVQLMNVLLKLFESSTQDQQISEVFLVLLLASLSKSTDKINFFLLNFKLFD